MVALRGKDIDSFLARPDTGRPIILLYGPDAGLVRERADALLKSAVDDPDVAHEARVEDRVDRLLIVGAAVGQAADAGAFGGRSGRCGLLDGPFGHAEMLPSGDAGFAGYQGSR